MPGRRYATLGFTGWGRAMGNYFSEPSATDTKGMQEHFPVAPVSTGPLANDQQRIAGLQDVVDKQQTVNRGLKEEYDLRVQSREQLRGMITAGAQLLDQTREQVRLARDEVTSHAARFSMRSRGEQHAIIGALQKAKNGTAGREVYLLLHQMGEDRGDIGRKLNQKLVETGGTETQQYAQLEQQLGGNETLDKANKQYRETFQADIVAKSFQFVLDNQVNNKRRDLETGQRRQNAAQNELSSLQAQTGHYTDPTVAASSVSGVVDRHTDQFGNFVNVLAEALMQRVDERLKTAIQTAAQRLKAGHG
jgi:hypothetical protein